MISSLTVLVRVDGTETVLVLHHGLLEVLLRLLHNPALHLLGADASVLVEINSVSLQKRKKDTNLFKIENIKLLIIYQQL